MTSEQWARLQGTTIFDNAGQKIGEVQKVFFDQGTTDPSWVTVHSGRFGGKQSFVPLAGSRLGDNGLSVSVSKDAVKHAPEIDAGTRLGEQDAARLNSYYHLPQPEQRYPGSMEPGRTEQAAGPMPAPTHMAEPTERLPEPESPEMVSPEQLARERAPQRAGGPDEVELTRHEEQLNIGTEPVESGKVRLHKYVVTEQVDTTVPLRHEEVRVERIPVTEAGPPATGHRFGEESAEVTLHEERARVVKESVPVEKVRLAAETHTEQQHVSDEVHRERIDVEDLRAGANRR